MKNRLTLVQGVLMLLAVIAIGSLIFVVRDQAPTATRPMDSVRADSTEARAVDPTLAFVRQVTATSDSLHDASIEIAEWLQTDVDTTGLAEHTADLSLLVDRGMERLLENPGAVSLEEIELLSSLYLDFLDAPSLAEVEPSFRAQAAAEYLRRLEQERSEIEGRLLRYIGVF
ncbi:MAG: hypothetical protein HKN29_10880 [Rhodothermales bacterium]|nr:hypothetical protein [Rhodothermales bacterium]